MADVQVPHSHIPYGKEGSGFFSDSSIGCFKVIDAATPMVLNALDKVPVKSLDAPFIIADFGTADGGTSMFLLKMMIELLRKKHGKDLPLQVVYEDQPCNDFKSLFFRIHGLLSHSPPSYMQEFDNVYVLASGTSFYSQCLPPGSLHFGMSFTAMHWLSTRPCRITGALTHVCITDPMEKALFQAQAAKDWETILLARAMELKSGGRMIVMSLCLDKEGHCLRSIKENICHTFNKYWKEMVSERDITQEEFDNTNFNVYYRTVQEYSAPFCDPNSAVSKSGLKLLAIETKVVRCPFHEKWTNSVGEGDQDAAANHAKRYIQSLRAWSNSSFLSGLDSSRSEEEKAAIVDKLFLKCEKAVASAPEDYGMDYEKFDNTNFNLYFRTVEEYRAPFCDQNSAVCKSGLKLLAIETIVVRCPFHEKLIKKGKRDDQEAAANHAKRFVQSTRAWSNSTFLSGLDSSRSEEKSAIVDKFFMKYEKAVASAPGDHGVDFVNSYIDIEKM